MDDTWQSEEARIAITWSSSNGRNRSRFLVRPISITRTPDLHQEWITIGRLAENLNRDQGTQDQLILIAHLKGSLSDGGWSFTKNHDRRAIVARSRGDRGLFIARSGTMASQRENAPTTPSIHAHDPIKGSKIGRDDQPQTWRNRRDRGWFSSKIEATTPQIDGPRSRAIVAIDSAPRPRQTAGNFGPNFLFKTMYSPLLCASTFDWFVKELSKFRGKS